MIKIWVSNFESGDKCNYHCPSNSYLNLCVKLALKHIQIQILPAMCICTHNKQ
jgi:hypothetical protein